MSSSSDEAKREAAESWTCDCGNIMPIAKARCGKCNHWLTPAKRQGKKKDRTVGGAWMCCDEIKPASQMRCGECNRLRGDTTSGATKSKSPGSSSSKKRKAHSDNTTDSTTLYAPPTAEELSQARINHAIRQIKVQIDPTTMAHLTAANRDIEILNLTQLHHETVRLKERLKAIEGRIEHLVKTKTTIRKRCAAEGCNNLAQKKGKCYAHGGGNKPVYCKHEGCSNQRQGAGGFCYRHGAKYRLCSVEGCGNKVQQGGVCFKHGAKRGTGKSRKGAVRREDGQEEEMMVEGA